MLSTCYFWCMKRCLYFQRSTSLHHISTWSSTTCSKTIFTLVDFDVLSLFLSWESQGQKNFFLNSFLPPFTPKQKQRCKKLDQWNFDLSITWRVADTCFQNLFLIVMRWGPGEADREEKAVFHKRGKDGWEVPGASEWHRGEELPSERTQRCWGWGCHEGDSASRRKTKLTVLPAL